jgi:hypothetical protein
VRGCAGRLEFVVQCSAPWYIALVLCGVVLVLGFVRVNTPFTLTAAGRAFTLPSLGPPLYHRSLPTSTHSHSCSTHSHSGVMVTLRGKALHDVRPLGGAEDEVGDLTPVLFLRRAMFVARSVCLLTCWGRAVVSLNTVRLQAPPVPSLSLSPPCFHRPTGPPHARVFLHCFQALVGSILVVVIFFILFSSG